MRIRRAILTLAIAAATTAGLAACGGDDDDNGSAATSSNASTSTQSSTGTSTAGATGQLDPSKPDTHIAMIVIKIPGSDLLTPYTVGANAAADAINAAGGFGGSKVVIDSCNSQNTAAVVTTCAHKLVADKPVALTGCDVNIGSAALPIFKRAGIPSFYCLNTPTDYSDPMAFGLDSGGAGQQVGMAKWICTQPDIKTVGNQLLDLPQVRIYSVPVKKVLEGCGKKVNFVYLSLTATDYTPTLNEVLSKKPDFVMAFGLSGPQTVQIFKAYEQAGFPADKMFAMSSSLDYDTMLKPAGAAMNGAYFVLPYANMEDTANPDVAAYKKALEGKSLNSFNANVETGYVYVQAIYTAAQKIGFDKFNSTSLAQFYSTQTGVHLPMSRELINPGPAGQPQTKQPYGQFVQWKDGKLTTIAEGTEEGWLKGQP
jgi:ABC-type branched-subunit amino acid transport system substrate-binding protein